MDEKHKNVDVSETSSFRFDPPRVTALVPAYNSSAFIGRMLSSLAGQTYPNLHILISDDASTDETLAVCRGFATTRENVTVVAHTDNLGWIGNSNYLLSAASGDFVFFAFDDDELDPAYVSVLVQALVSHPDAVVAYSDMLLKSYTGWSEVFSFELLDENGGAVGRARRLLKGTATLWITFRGLYRKSACDELGGLKRHFLGEQGADWLWLLGMSLRGTFIRVPQVLYTKNKRASGVGSGWSRTFGVRLVVFLLTLREIMVSPLSLPERLRLATYTIASKSASLLVC